MSWSLTLDRNGSGTISSDDHDGDGVMLTGIRDVRELVECIDVILREGGRRNYIREDGNLVEVYVSTSRPGKYVIERQNGNWVRLGREDMRDLRNELLRRISSPSSTKDSEVPLPHRDTPMDNIIRNIQGAQDIKAQVMKNWRRIQGEDE